MYIDSIVSRLVLQQAQIYQKYSTRRLEHSGVNAQFISVVLADDGEIRKAGIFFLFFPRYSSKLLAKIVCNARYRPVEILFVAFQITATLKLLDFAYKDHNGETFS